jgi:bifunctional enzyme CysN/CysC
MFRVGVVGAKPRQSIKSSSAGLERMKDRVIANDQLQPSSDLTSASAFNEAAQPFVYKEKLAISKQERQFAKSQKASAIWLTGLSGAGKSTIAKLVEQKLFELGHHTYVLDGDNVRSGLCRDLKFSDDDRAENIRRVGEVAKLFVDSGLIVLCALISPFRVHRDAVRQMFEPGEFFEIYVNTPLKECMMRDPKHLYAKAHAGAITDFTAVSSPYEEPLKPELDLRTVGRTPEECANDVIETLVAAGRIPGIGNAQNSGQRSGFSLR